MLSWEKKEQARAGYAASNSHLNDFCSRRANSISNLAYDIVAWQKNHRVCLNHHALASGVGNIFYRLVESKRVSPTPAAN
jgi:hypothetical protein